MLHGPHPKLVSCIRMLRNNRMAANPSFLVGLDVLDRTRMALERFVPAALQVLLQRQWSVHSYEHFIPKEFILRT
jgi:hypothetical protein